MRMAVGAEIASTAFFLFPALLIFSLGILFFFPSQNQADDE